MAQSSKCIKLIITNEKCKAETIGPWKDSVDYVRLGNMIAAFDRHPRDLMFSLSLGGR